MLKFSWQKLLGAILTEIQLNKIKFLKRLIGNKVFANNFYNMLIIRSFRLLDILLGLGFFVIYLVFLKVNQPNLKKYSWCKSRTSLK